MRGGFTLVKFGKVALNSINFNFAGDLSGAKSNVAALDMGGGSTRALDVRLNEWCCSVSMVCVQIPSREEQKF
jgi:hypothetical protein